MIAGGAPDYDAVVIGLGFAGIYQLRKLRDELGMNVRAFDEAGGVGGTWYWNRYPGATSDTESFVYRFSFDRDLLQDSTWSRRYLTQPEILDYLEDVVDRFDLRKDIQLDTLVESLIFDDESDSWRISTSDGRTVTARYVVSALGSLAATNFPRIEGRDRFDGTIVHTAQWPADLSLEGQRVGVIGTGSTGIQLIIAASKVASQVTVFQRSAQYVVPSGDRPVTVDELTQVKADYGRIWDQVRSSNTAFGFVESTVSAASVSVEERSQVFERAWERGNGFYFMFGTFNDIITSVDANHAATDFIKGKIAETVTDPETARKLTPTDLYARRPLCSLDYYEVYNRPNVSLVDVKDNPIVEITATGVRTADGVVHDLDVLVFATGFDAIDGNYRRVDIRGRGGKTLKDHWGDRPTGYLGVATSGFPNLFMVVGPHSPFTSHVPAIEVQVEFITDVLRAAQEQAATQVEASASAEAEWTALCESLAAGTLLPKVDSWIFGGNVAGKQKTTMVYLGGLGAYRDVLADVEQRGFADFGLGVPEEGRR